MDCKSCSRASGLKTRPVSASRPFVADERLGFFGLVAALKALAIWAVGKLVLPSNATEPTRYWRPSLTMNWTIIQCGEG